jgi:hypothetical protein
MKMVLAYVTNVLVDFFLSFWIYLWLAETSQQPISQTTWLKVTPHCNHCNRVTIIQTKLDPFKAK